MPSGPHSHKAGRRSSNFDLLAAYHFGTARPKLRHQEPNFPAKLLGHPLHSQISSLFLRFSGF